MRILLAALLAVPVVARAQMSMPMPMPMNQPAQETPTTPEPSPVVPDLLHDAAQRPSLSLDDWYALALRQSPALAVARARVRSLDAEARQAGLAPNPEIGYQGDQIRGGSYHGGEQGAYLQQRIVLGGKLSAARSAREAEARTAQIAVDEAEARLRSDVGQGFFAALRAQSAIAVRRDLLAIAHDAVLTQRGYVNAGIQDTPDALSAEVEEETAAVDLLRAQRDYIAAFRTLSALAGETEPTLRPLTGDLATPPADDDAALAQRVRTDSPSIKRAQAQIAAASASVLTESRSAIPDLTLKAGEQWNGEELNNGRVTGAQSFASASLQIPLWNRNQFGTSAARIRVEETRAQLALVQLAATARASTLEQQLAAARYTATRFHEAILPRAERAFIMYRTQYNGMTAPYSQVLQWQRRLAELRIGYLDTLEELWRTHIALENYGLGSDPMATRIPPLSEGNDAGSMIHSGNGNMIQGTNGRMLQ